MAYAVAVSLKRNLKQLIQFSDRFAIYCPESYITSLDQVANSIQAFLQENYPGGECLEKEIKHTLWRAEDIVESYISSSESNESSLRNITSLAYQTSEDLLRVMQEIESMKERIEKFVNRCKLEEMESFNERREKFDNDFKLGARPFAASLSSYDSPQCENKMVGLDSELNKLKHFILGQPQHHLGAAVIDGMGGIGKTSLAINFFNDSDVRNHFSLGAWVKISLEHCVGDILLSLLHSVEFFGHGMLDEKIQYEVLMKENDDEKLANFLRELFGVRRYLVVVDCLCDINISSWDYIKTVLPDSNNGSRIILVNRMLFMKDDEFVFCYHRKHFLDKDSSWNLLREKVFGEEKPCPPELERIGKKIAWNCKGLPLAIITTGLHLAKEQKTVEYWNKVAESGNSLAYRAGGEAMYQQLGLSYKQMPPVLRPLFLYMVVFPEDHDIPVSLIQDLWIAEGFLDLEELNNLNPDWIATFYIRKLVDYRETENYAKPTCYLHHAMWHFCCSEAEKDGLFHIVDKYHNWDSPRPARGMINTSVNLRRLVIRNNLIFSLCKLKHNSLSNIHSLHFNGPDHPYPLRIFSDNYKKLRVLNALSIRFCNFPAEILSPTLLRFLGLTVNRGELPIGISKLRNLQFLIVRLHHQIVRSFGENPSYLPMEIWEMQELMHLECMGNDLPVLPEHSDGLKLPNLLTLLSVSPHSCRKEVLERIPNLKKLGISIDLAPRRSSEFPFCPFDHLALLQKLHVLDCVITNPYFEGKTQVVAMPERASDFMYGLTSMTLSGCGFSWEKIEQISHLPVLSELKLRCNAFRGPNWVLTKGTGFKRLHSLILEDLDLVYWTGISGDQFFPCLALLHIVRCHKLQEITRNFVRCYDLCYIKIVDCSPAVENWGRFIHTQLSHRGKLSLVINNPKGAPIIIE